MLLLDIVGNSIALALVHVVALLLLSIGVGLELSRPVLFNASK